MKMSPSHFNEDAQKQPLKVSKDSHSPMKRSSPPSSSSSSSSSPQSSLSSASSSGSALANAASRGGPSRGPHHRQPVIIYTHSPKVIHTQPQDFMALVQKLTGLCRPEEDQDGRPPPSQRTKREPSSSDDPEHNKNQFKITLSDETDSSSVITDENISVNSIGDSQVINSSFLPPPPIFEGPPNPYMAGFPVFNPSSATDYLLPNQSNFYNNYGDRLFFGPNIRSTFSSGPSLEMMMNEFREC